MKAVSAQLFLLILISIVATAQHSTAFGQDNAQEPKADRGYLGLMYTLDEGDSLVVLETLRNSPAYGTIYANDVVLAVDGAALDKEVSVLHELMKTKKPGDTISLKIERLGRKKSIEITLAAPPKDMNASKVQFETITFPSEDGLSITANLYANVETADAPFIVLCHQAGWSRGEYLEIAPKLNDIGFNCVAIDQRSGNAVGLKNKTVLEAKKAGKPEGFVDAEQDMLAALKWAKKENPDSKIILWGSSYSSALSLRIAGEHPELVDGVLAFAPGEYFARFGKPKDWITTSAKKIKAPAFITSAKKEAPNWKSIYDAIPGNTKMKFLPTTTGNHGSRALWERFNDHEAYWESVTKFLSQFQSKN